MKTFQIISNDNPNPLVPIKSVDFKNGIVVAYSPNSTSYRFLSLVGQKYGFTFDPLTAPTIVFDDPASAVADALNRDFQVFVFENWQEFAEQMASPSGTQRKTTSFKLTETEQQTLQAWMNMKDLSLTEGASGGRFTYSFTPTSLGNVIRVSDAMEQKDSIDVTDYGAW